MCDNELTLDDKYRLRKMYFPYVNELNEYKTKKMDDEEIETLYCETINNINMGNTKLYFIGDMGFVLIGVNENKHPLYSYFIEDIYIKPNYRRNHYANKNICKILDEFSGTGTLYILDNNATGKAFWKSVGRLIQLNDNYDICPEATQYILVRHKN